VATDDKEKPPEPMVLVMEWRETMSEESKMMPIPAGSLLTVTTGEYRNWCTIDGVFLAKSDIDPESLRDQWLQDHPDQREEHCFEEGNFLAWTASLGLIEPLDCYEWHLSNYSIADQMDVQKLANGICDKEKPPEPRSAGGFWGWTKFWLANSPRFTGNVKAPAEHSAKRR
jgi:hypothetical protein